jgi:hypothetical protein
VAAAAAAAGLGLLQLLLVAWVCLQLLLLQRVRQQGAPQDVQVQQTDGRNTPSP